MIRLKTFITVLQITSATAYKTYMAYLKEREAGEEEQIAMTLANIGIKQLREDLHKVCVFFHEVEDD